eukprot:CAMPEP_0171509378 /NCGR_PEP_ID=MMETSP0958-20121227/14743_1 /TAXON_ID=87120 /ORGANISM="Aurantiochytrium limacinum, Strain ATCCMYA-1381" /LENGTH=218 /DNA_ID=CAMNT_0012046623 /DNA_START=104 /DNA_END=760 /DNA_ORIENTATION=+
MDGLLDKEMGENTGDKANQDVLQANGKQKRAPLDLPADMTVEEYLNAECEKQVADIQNYAQGLVEKLKNEYASLKKEFMNDLKEEAARKAAEEDTNDQDNMQVVLHFNVVEGVYQGKTYTLNVECGKPAFIGRSRGKKFYQPGGISLSRDDETSTTHGRFDLKEDGTCTYTDLTSTNGSFLNYSEDKLEENVETMISVDDVLKIGTNFFKLCSIDKSS